MVMIGLMEVNVSMLKLLMIFGIFVFMFKFIVKINGIVIGFVVMLVLFQVIFMNVLLEIIVSIINIKYGGNSNQINGRLNVIL